MSKLIEMREKYPQTEPWADSFYTANHVYGLTQGITGITTSPTWMSRMLCNKEGSEHEKILCELQGKHPEYNEQKMIRARTLEMGKRRSRVLFPPREQENPRQRRFPIRTSIYDYSNTEKTVHMTEEIDSYGPNMQVKIPSIKEEIKVMEETTFKGTNVMATVCFSVDRAAAVAKATEQGMKRRTVQGLSNTDLNLVCAILLGMQEDWPKSCAESRDIVIRPDAFA